MRGDAVSGCGFLEHHEEGTANGLRQAHILTLPAVGAVYGCVEFNDAIYKVKGLIWADFHTSPAACAQFSENHWIGLVGHGTLPERGLLVASREGRLPVTFS